VRVAPTQAGYHSKQCSDRVTQYNPPSVFGDKNEKEIIRLSKLKLMHVFVRSDILFDYYVLDLNDFHRVVRAHRMLIH